MSITICNLEKAVKIAPEFDYVISILDPKVKMETIIVNHIILNMADTEHPSNKEGMEQVASVRYILDWVADKKITLDDKILVHCHAGVSRSSAIAWLILVQLGMDMEKAFDYLFSVRPEMWPNLRVMEIGDRFLSMNGELYKFAKRKNAAISIMRGIWDEDSDEVRAAMKDENYRSPYGG